jgi:hypothetical protein
VTLDPSSFAITNTFPYEHIQVSIDDKNNDQILVDMDKTTFVYKTSYRSHLLCQLFQAMARKLPSKLSVLGPYEANRLRKDGSRVNCHLLILSYGIVEEDGFGNTLQEYMWTNVTRCGSDDESRTFFFEYSGRTKIFSTNNVEQIIQACKTQLRQLGQEGVRFLAGQSFDAVLQYRMDLYAAIPAPVSIFDVSKYTRRSARPLSRQLHISEEFVTEMDGSGFQATSFQSVQQIYALVRSWDNSREFSIEYNDGSRRVYSCSTRDTLLAMLLDVCHAAGNQRVIVTGEVSDGLRLMPRFAEEDYQATVKDAFFGASSVEAWFLNHLAKVCRLGPGDSKAVVQACRELNANVPCPGVSPNSDQTLIQAAMDGVLGAVQSEVVKAAQTGKADNARAIAIMLQTVFRLIPCIHGYKAFVEVKEIDTRLLLLQLLKYDDDFVNYWALEVLMMLCKCPLSPRNMQQEYVNKHTVLTSKMLEQLVSLMSSRLDVQSPGNDDSPPIDENTSPSETSPVADSKPPTMLLENGAVSSKKQRVASNPSTLSHLPVEYTKARPKVSSAPVSFEAKEPVGPVASDYQAFAPNSLVVIGAAALLESVISSRKDTTSPELLKEILDLLADRCEILVNMMRSTSFLILENAAILMFCILKYRSQVALPLREMVLCEGLVLKHFYNAVFSPSGTQRFLSRFLIATWLTGSPKSNPGKALLLRMLPSGLVEYLKYSAISEDQRFVLDQLEEDFYAAFSGFRNSINKSNSSAMHTRMRKRIAVALKEQPLFDRNAVIAAAPSSSADSTASSANPQNAPTLNTAPPSSNISSSTATAGPSKQPENYRVLFHMITRNHKLPDLIWNDQTRLELRSALETELKSFEREQRLRGNQKLAWNFQQFQIHYDSLREEMQVGPIYVRYFLDAGDSFLKQLDNPTPTVLFEKLIRRVLVNIDYNPSVSTMCSRCLCRLYEVCRDSIGVFDDMVIIVRMLDQTSSIELQQRLLDLLVLLCQEDGNLLQLLDKTFVDAMVKFVSLAHIQPDQIGNVLARATNSLLMIKDGAVPRDADVNRAREIEAEGSGSYKASPWIPEDAACPKVWYAASPSSSFPPSKQLQQGPFRVSELFLEVQAGRIGKDWFVAPMTADEGDDEKFEAIVDTGRWRPIQEYFQLRMQLLFTGTALHSPAFVSSQCLRLLQRLAAVHKSANFKGTPFYPIAMSKRIMSDPSHLAIFSQLLLSNDHAVVDSAADLLTSLVEFNLQACSKLYLSGAFFFAARYSGNNFRALAQFFHATHLQQSNLDATASVARDLPACARSVLSSLFPPAMISILHNYGPDHFAAVHTGEFDTPEVIWNASLRRHLVEMVEQHLGDFPARLRQFSLLQYEYIPIPKIHYQALEKEIYVHEYYLRNLCDEARFPDWPIGDPLALLRASIERWREERSKGVVDSAVNEAIELLGLPGTFDTNALRKAYKSLARQFHPDKNPEGREKFEKIQLAYELLSSVELKEADTDVLNLIYLIRTQSILYRRFPEKIGDQKYPAYSLLDEVTQVPEHGVSVEGRDREVLLASVELMYFTTDVSPLNAREFVKAGLVGKLYAVLRYALSLMQTASAQGLGAELLVTTMKTFTSVANVDEGRAEVLAHCPAFAEDLYALFQHKAALPLAVENGIEVVSRCCAWANLQQAMVNAGLVWRLVPLLLDYDNTLEDAFADEQQRFAGNQYAANVQAVLAAKALGRLGGYMFDELASPSNPYVKASLDRLLTPPLAKLLRNRRPWELLQALNENVETATKIWNLKMRQELLDFALSVQRNRAPGSQSNDLDVAENFSFSALRDELCIGGVYLRVFNKTRDTADIDDPSVFTAQILDFVQQSVSAADPPSARSRLHLDYAVEGLCVLSEIHGYVALDVGRHPKGVDVVFSLLDQSPNTACFLSASRLLHFLCSSADFVAIVCSRQPPVLHKLLRCVCTVAQEAAGEVWAAAEVLAVNTEGLTALLDTDLVVHLLGVLIAVPGYSNAFSSRAAAMSLLSKCLWNPTKGGDASALLRRSVVTCVYVCTQLSMLYYYVCR